MKSILFFLLALTANATFAHNNSLGENTENCPPFTLIVTLKAGTAIMLELDESFDSDDATVGRVVNLKVRTDVRVNGRVVVKTGALATGRISKISEATFNNPATVSIEARNVQTVDGNMIALNGTELKLKGIYPGQGMTVEIGAKMIANIMNETEIYID